jgi:hypothetical protein
MDDENLTMKQKARGENVPAIFAWICQFSIIIFAGKNDQDFLGFLGFVAMVLWILAMKHPSRN